MSRSSVLVLVVVCGFACGSKSDPLKQDLERFCARTDVATKPPNEWAPSVVAETKSAELLAVFEKLKDGSVGAVRAGIEELARKAGVARCAAIESWPRE